MSFQLDNFFCATGIINNELKLNKTASGNEVTTFLLTIPAPEKFSNTKIKCTAWDTKAIALVNSVKKGSKVKILGFLVNNRWIKDGIRRQNLAVEIKEYEIERN